MAAKKMQGWSRDQLIESMAWFSFHVPDVVLDNIDAMIQEKNLEEAELARNSVAVEEIAEINENATSKVHVNAKSKEAEAEVPVTRKKCASAYASLNPPAVKTRFREDPLSKSSNFVHANRGDKDEDSESMSLRRKTQSDVNNLDLGLSLLTPFRTSDPQYFIGPSHFEVPEAHQRECALLFVDISGFTKLSTVMDVESFSETINSYFDLIVNEIKSNGGDVLKFAGDALFAEWRDTTSLGGKLAGGIRCMDTMLKGLKKLSRSSEHDDIEPAPKRTLDMCVADAALCGCLIVEKFSDYKVDGYDAILNVHCGISAGLLTCVHVADDKGLRREFLLLGDPIDQVAEAEKLAQHGELYASKECIQLLAKCCRVPHSILTSDAPASLIASRAARKIAPSMMYQRNNSVINDVSQSKLVSVSEELRTDYEDVETKDLEMLQRQLALYIHPVVREDEFAKRIFADSNNSSVTFTHRRQRAEAELRSVYVMFITPLIQTKITGNQDEDEKVYRKLDGIMSAVCHQLDSHNGHLRQFIVDDKGVVLIASFGLRWSTSPNMVAKRALPATLAIHKSLQEMGIDSRIGATFDEAYCGVVGGIRRHEYSILGPSVNLAARLMCSKENESILVDEAVQSEGGSEFSFTALDPIIAKGYDHPVNVYRVEKHKNKLPFSLPDGDLKPVTRDDHDKSIFQLYLTRIDSLQVTTRSILQACAVIGDEFTFSDIVRVSPVTYRNVVDGDLKFAVDKNILKIVNDNCDQKPRNRRSSTGFLIPVKTQQIPEQHTQSLPQTKDNCFQDKTIFCFMNELWREALLKTMLTETKNQMFNRTIKP